MVTPLILQVYHALGVLEARLLEETEDGAFRLHNARRYRLTVEHTRGHRHTVPSHRALEVPGHPGVTGGVPSGLRHRIWVPRRVQVTRRRGTARARRGRQV